LVVFGAFDYATQDVDLLDEAASQAARPMLSDIIDFRFITVIEL
jgi:hypothetical protein